MPGRKKILPAGHSSIHMTPANGAQNGVLHMSETTVRRMAARRRSQLSRAQAKAAWGLSAPAIIIMFLFMILPFFLSVFYSFTNRKLVVNPKNPTAFVGMANYVKVFTNKTALKAFFNTFEYTIILVPSVLVLATLLALLINRKAKGVTLFRMIYFSPQVVTMTVVAVIWGFFFSSTSDGLFNSLLGLFGLPSQKWLQDTGLAMPAIAIMSIWQCVGLQMIIVLGGLQFIPEELYEAGTIDGADTWQQFIYITIPQLKNTLVYVFISNTIYSLKMFTQVYMLTQGGPANSTTTLVYLMYQEGFTNNRVGYTSALAVVFFLIVLVISLIQNKVTEGD